jgi:hypothetical protein
VQGEGPFRGSHRFYADRTGASRAVRLLKMRLQEVSNGHDIESTTAATILATISEQPARAASLPLDVAQHLLEQANARVAAIQLALDALIIRLAAASLALDIAEPKNKSRTLNADQIAAALGQKRRWVFTNPASSFVRRISRKAMVRFEDVKRLQNT